MLSTTISVIGAPFRDLFDDGGVSTTFLRMRILAKVHKDAWAQRPLQHIQFTTFHEQVALKAK